ncbi:MAG: 30S ribosomal protein S12 methylthiotransferase RimO, partial [Gammaproteobacteria bacterium]|nr:30S ribosomal protein S12 methylthiotransferase RimO [Gammaproteobacteria bacterium]
MPILRRLDYRLKHFIVSATPPRVGFVSLGCPKATVDSERILTELRAEGYEISRDYQSSDVVVVNTCGFIDDAIEESLDAIGEAIDQNGKVIVTGCLGAKSDIVKRNHPKVLAVTGPQATNEVLQAVHSVILPVHDPFTSLIPPGGIKLTPRHYAYLKISEGCNHRCSFCIIPSMRGDLLSRPINDVLQEAEELVSAGVKELLVISQDTSAYGVDRRYRSEIHDGNAYKTRLFDLANALGALGVWVRLHYVYPYPNVDDLIPLMAEGKVLPYLDIPFQHASPRLLKSMRRPANSENTLRRIENWREVCPDITIRSTFIVGFPGETEVEFEELLGFLDDAQLDRVGCFAYSPVAGAAANELDDPIPDEEKQERQERFMHRQAAISAAKLENKIGSTIPVIVDEVDSEHAIARSQADAPEIDGIVEITEASELWPGNIVDVKINNASEHDLFAS